MQDAHTLTAKYHKKRWPFMIGKLKQCFLKMGYAQVVQWHLYSCWQRIFQLWQFHDKISASILESAICSRHSFCTVSWPLAVKSAIGFKNNCNLWNLRIVFILAKTKTELYSILPEMSFMNINVNAVKSVTSIRLCDICAFALNSSL